jgi:hypothetical protein
MLRRVALVRTDVSKELNASFIRVTGIGELGKTSVVPSSPIPVTLMKEALSASETSVLTRSQKTPFFIVAAVKTSNLTTALIRRMKLKSADW